MPARKVTITEVLKGNAGISKSELRRSRKMLGQLRRNGMKRPGYRLGPKPAEGRVSSGEAREDARTVVLRRPTGLV
jgi:hypothetical protein